MKNTGPLPQRQRLRAALNRLAHFEGQVYEALVRLRLDVDAAALVAEGRQLDEIVSELQLRLRSQRDAAHPRPTGAIRVGAREGRRV